MFDRSFDREPLPLQFVLSPEEDSLDRLPDAFTEEFRIEHSGEGGASDPDSQEEYYGLIEGEGELSGNRPSSLSALSTGSVPRISVENLRDPEHQLRFVNQIYGFFRWQRFRSDASDISELIEFHSHQKLTLLAHDPSRKNELGHMLANPSEELEFEAFLDQYGNLYRSAFRTVPTRERHFNVLEHLYGYLSELLPGDQRSAVLETIRAFHRGEVSLSEPLRVLKNHFDGRSIEWVNRQSYLNPTHREWTLRSRLRSELDGFR
jgi:uncharacterized protein YbgA (DUF1722 family)